MSRNKHWLVPDWPTPANIHAATTLRTGGVSTGVFSSLNPATHVGDGADQVRQNRAIIKAMLALPDEPVWLEQIHSNRVIKAEKNGLPQQADASFTNEAGVICAVMTADCLPLLFCTADGSRIAAVHAGWRGLLAGIISNTVTAMQNSPSTPVAKREIRIELLAWLGPAIGPDCFEVGSEVRTAFLEKSADFSVAFKQQDTDKWLADIYQLARIELLNLGVASVYGGDFCTVTESERFYSYRRDNQTGRMVTLIWRD